MSKTDSSRLAGRLVHVLNMKGRHREAFKVQSEYVQADERLSEASLATARELGLLYNGNNGEQLARLSKEFGELLQ